MGGRKGLTDQECRNLLERLGYPPDDPVRHLEIPVELVDAIAAAREQPTPANQARARDALARIQLLARQEVLDTTKLHVRSRTRAHCEAHLTKRESEVLNLVALGFENDEIGRAMKIATETVKTHMRNIASLLGTHNRTQAVVIAIARGYILLDDVVEALEALAADQAA